MGLLVIMLVPHLLFFDELAALDVPRGDYWLAAAAVLAADDGQFEVVGLV